MMHRKPRLGAYRFDDFMELIQSDQKADLIDGSIHLASPQSVEENDLVGWLLTVLGQYLEEKKLGEITVNRVAYRLNESNAPEPDLGVVLTPRLRILRGGYVDGAPDVAVEIVSPDSVERDYEDKRLKYEEAGVKEYWILDPDEQRATFLIRDARMGAGFSESILEDAIFRSRAITGFWLDIRWLWMSPRPTTLSVAKQLLAGT